MSEVTQILVSRWSADPVELTALSTLRKELGFGESLKAVRRRVLWELEAPERGAGGLDGLLERLRIGGEIWNPNKEVARIRRPGAGASDLGDPSQREDDWVMLLAWNPERDEDRVPHSIVAHRRLGWRLARGTVWCMQWASPDPAERAALSRRAAVCRSRKEGLLIHPHLEIYRSVTSSDPVPWIRRVAVVG